MLHLCTTQTITEFDSRTVCPNSIKFCKKTDMFLNDAQSMRMPERSREIGLYKPAPLQSPTAPSFQQSMRAQQSLPHGTCLPSDCDPLWTPQLNLSPTYTEMIQELVRNCSNMFYYLESRQPWHISTTTLERWCDSPDKRSAKTSFVPHTYTWVNRDTCPQRSRALTHKTRKVEWKSISDYIRSKPTLFNAVWWVLSFALLFATAMSTTCLSNCARPVLVFAGPFDKYQRCIGLD